MANGNVRVRERFELALDGLQIASIVVGALLTVSAVFVLGLKMGQHLAARQASAARPADLGALDRPVVTTATAPAAPPLQYADKLPKQKPAPPPPLEQPARPAALGTGPAPTPTTLARSAAPSSAPAPTAAPLAAERSVPTAAEVAAPAPAAAPAAGSARTFTVQLASATSREDATKVATRVPGHAPRIVEADVPGKGHYFRVRVGRFETREAAERFRDDLARETSLKGVVMTE